MINEDGAYVLSTPASAPREMDGLFRTMARTRWDVVVGIAVGAVWFAVALHHGWSQPIDHDARGYMWLSQAIVRGRGGTTEISDFLDVLFGIRLMGYPIFLAPFVAVGLEGLGLRIAIAVVQTVLFWAAVLVVRSSLARVADLRLARRVTICVLALPFPYFLSVELITESISISIALLSLGAVLHALTAESVRRRCTWTGVALACAGAVMVVRKDNLFVPTMCIVGLAIVFSRGHGRRPLKRFTGLATAGATVAVSIALFRVPQFLVLRARTGTGNWDTPSDLTKQELEFGVTVLKWATGIRKISGAFAYRNPYLTSDAVTRFGSDPMSWYWHEPLRALALVGTKWFALLDQDVPFVYNDTISGRPNAAVFVVNHVVVLVGIVGFVRLVRISLGRGSGANRRAATLVCIAGALVWLGTHALPHVEARYGFAALVALAACAGAWASVERMRAHWRVLLAGLIAYLPLAWMFSTWLMSFRTQLT